MEKEVKFCRNCGYNLESKPENAAKPDVSEILDETKTEELQNSKK